MRRSPRSEVEAETIPVVSRLLEEGAVTQASDANLRRLRECAAAVQRGDHDAAARIAEGLHGLPVRARPSQLKRRLVSLDPATDALLASTGNASAYVRALVADAWTDWTEALAELRAAGWDGPRILAASEDPAARDDEAMSRSVSVVARELRRKNAALERALERE